MSTPSDSGKLRRVQNKVDEVAGVMRTNIDDAIERGVKLERLESSSQALEEQSRQFQRNSRQLKNKFCCENAKRTLIIVGIVLVILAILAAVIAANVKR